MKIAQTCNVQTHSGSKQYKMTEEESLTSLADVGREFNFKKKMHFVVLHKTIKI